MKVVYGAASKTKWVSGTVKKVLTEKRKAAKRNATYITATFKVGETDGGEEILKDVEHTIQHFKPKDPNAVPAEKPKTPKTSGIDWIDEILS